MDVIRFNWTFIKVCCKIVIEKVEVDPSINVVMEFNLIFEAFPVQYKWCFDKQLGWYRMTCTNVAPDNLKLIRNQIRGELS